MELKPNPKIIRPDLIYPELSYQIVGILFDIYNELGGGYREKYYNKAIALRLKKCNLVFKENLPVVLNFNGNKIGHYFLDLNVLLI